MITEKRHYRNYVVETTVTPTPILAYYLARVDSFYMEASGKPCLGKFPLDRSFDLFYEEYKIKLTDLYPDLFSGQPDIKVTDLIEAHCRNIHIKFLKDLTLYEKELENRTPRQDCTMLTFDEQYALGRMNLSQMKVQLRQFYMDGYTVGTAEALLYTVREKCGKNTEKADKYFREIQSYVNWLETKYILQKVK